ncbi:macrophage mannose receptor 1-like, partial [Acipenser oxyrinchus oxyrinchus]
LLCTVFQHCFSGLCEDASCQTRKYNLVNINKNWTDARSYCREKHTDLVTVRSLEEQQQILNVAKDYQFWIGLYRDSDNWEWSTGDVVSYTKWTAGSDSLFCATADATGSWDKSSCHDQKPFMCYNGKKYTPISTLKTWAEAQQYCRQHHTDLVSIKSASENEDMKKKAPASPFWIGLFNNPWKWTDGGNSTFQNWNTFEPNGASEKCVLMYSSNQGKWEDWPCSYWKYFVCYDGKDFYSFWLLFELSVQTLKTWTDARSYCREKHTDLVTVRSLEEQQQILNVAKNDRFWIGLYRHSENWQWSTGDAVSYTKWTAGSDSLFCATADAGGSWDKSSCRDQKPFMCYNGKRYTLISTPKTWPEAQQYCRQHHTDLVSIKSASENEDMKKKAPASPFWIGLFNNPWKWADEENSTFQNWNTFEPTAGGEKCVLMYSPNQGKWKDWPCSYETYFFCYEGKDLYSFWILFELSVQFQFNIQHSRIHHYR